MNNFVPEERLKVFISSAQNTEDDLNWLNFRKKVREKIATCPYLSPFTIETRVSELPSVQYMLRNVDKSDIIILLIKNDFRTGTAQEYKEAIKMNKPLMVYFCSNEKATDDVKKLKRELQDNDRCTYKKLDSFDNAEEIILNDIILNVITYYQDQHFFSHSEDSDFDKPSIVSEVSIDKYNVPIKTSIECFSSAYNHIYELLGMSWFSNNTKAEQSQLHDSGVNVLNWLVNGIAFNCSSICKELLPIVTPLYSDTKWFVKRFEALSFILKGDFCQAYDREKEAYSLATEFKLPHWIINDILIDIRNLEHLVIRKNPEKIIDIYAQDIINEIDTLIYMPVIDRYLENAYKGVHEEEIKRNTATYGTTFLGSNMNTVISEVENSFFSSFFYGSYTHMILTRDTLSKILYKYGKLFDNSEIIYASLKMMLLSGQCKDFKRIVNLEWCSINNIIVTKSDELWNDICKAEVNRQETIKINTLSKIGLYLSDDNFVDAGKYILELSQRLTIDLSDDYFDCIINLCDRFKQSDIVKALITIINNKSYSLARKLVALIFKLKITKVSKDILEDFCKALSNNIEYIVKHSGDPQFISYLIEEGPDIFSCLENIPNNGLQGIYRQLFDINMGKGDLNILLETAIDKIESQYKDNATEAVFVAYAFNPYEIIDIILDKTLSKETIVLLNTGLMPILEEILQSKAQLQIKDMCAQCLCNILGYYKKNSISIPEHLSNMIVSLNFRYNASESFSPFSSNEGLNCKILLMKVMIGAVNKDELVAWGISFGNKELVDRLSISQCLRTFLLYSTDINKSVDIIIISLIFQCCNDPDVRIRKIACECLCAALESKYCDKVENKLFEMIIDPVPAVRSFIFYLCKSNEIKDNKIKERLLETLSHDANYTIRKNAKEYLTWIATS